VLASAYLEQRGEGRRLPFDALTSPEGQALVEANVTLLHCTTEYPAPLDQVNLRAMDTLRQAFGVSVGYSDHTEGASIPIAAVALGASVIEKHFTLDRSMEGPDHRASIEPVELAAMVRGIRAVETALGRSIKRPGPAEIANRPIARRSVVAAVRIAQGQTISLDMLATKRPGAGISPMLIDELVGRPASRDYEPDDPIER
ncbi:MAG: N-acetylneuraminate synthase family protein, partial [Myxococcales bacterium]|nr:N-acetylneuraminate synthase family protein [Myxococcales bacterium]